MHTVLCKPLLWNVVFLSSTRLEIRQGTYVHGYKLYASLAGLKVGRMTRTMWVTWVTFLKGQVGLIHKLNYLDVTRIF